MSIIQEALKKAQRKNITLETFKKAPMRHEFYEERVSSGSFRSRAVIYGIVLVCVILVLVVKYYPSRPVKIPVAPIVDSLKEPVKPVAVIPAPVIAIAQKIEPVIVEVKPSIVAEDFILSGIMDLEDGKRAIINNLVVVEGDMIGDVKVGTITTKNVTLKKGQDSVTLRLK